MSPKTIKFIVALVLQLLVILGIVIYKEAILVGGTPVMLQIEPVDPTDLLRGDYATFNFNISTINSSNFVYSPVKKGDQVYVPLVKGYDYRSAQPACIDCGYTTPSTGIWEAGYSISKTKPSSGTFIKGIVVSGTDSQSFSTGGFGFQIPSSGQVRLNYGIEQYFVPQGAGRTLGFRNQAATAKVYLDDNGNAVLKQIYINGKPWPQEAVDSSNDTSSVIFTPPAAVNNVSNSRDARRLADVRLAQTALELYYNDQSAYPNSIADAAQPIDNLGLGSTGINKWQPIPTGTVYVQKLGPSPTPVDGTCTDYQNNYMYTSVAPYSTYTLTFCLGGAQGGFAAGVHTATPSGIQ